MLQLWRKNKGKKKKQAEQKVYLTVCKLNGNKCIEENAVIYLKKG